MSAPNIRELFDRFNAEHFGGEINDIQVVWSKKLRTTAGRCHYHVKKVDTGFFVQKFYTPYKIDLSYKLFEANGWEQDKIERTLIHEMVHAYLAQKYNMKGHTPKFQRMMRNITGENVNHRCHAYDTSQTRNRRKWEAHCPSHGVVGTRARKPKYMHGWTCKQCKQRIEWKVNGHDPRTNTLDIHVEL